MKAIETEYNGYRFRSRLEARWAVFFDKMGIRYEYEPEGLVLSDGTYYLPDFYLPDFHCYFEVKRAGIEGTSEGKEAVRKISDGMTTGEWAGIICYGDPMDDDMVIYCQEVDDDGGGNYSSDVTFGISPGNGKPLLFAWLDNKERIFYPNWHTGYVIPLLTAGTGNTSRQMVAPEKVRRARSAARQARFEHGERPVTRE